MTDDNALVAPAADSIEHPGKPLWFYRFVILNTILITLPLAVAVTIYVVLAAKGIEVSGSSGTLRSDALLLPLGYIALPNLIMITVWRLGVRRGRTVPNH